VSTKRSGYKAQTSRPSYGLRCLHSPDQASDGPPIPGSYGPDLSDTVDKLAVVGAQKSDARLHLGYIGRIPRAVLSIPNASCAASMRSERSLAGMTLFSALDASSGLYLLTLL